MRHLHLLSLLLTFSAVAQPGEDILRSLAGEELKPFYHGVASGDPLADRVIIWTRVTPESQGPVEGTWIMGTDTTLSDTVRYGTFTTDASRDYTVKIDVDGLQPDTWYYYEFSALNRRSLIGRTKTAPSGATDQLRFAVVSCSSYETGYFNVYRKIRDRNDLDAVLHLGDYIYEYGSNDLLGGPRSHVPDHEIIALADYRMRHAQHKLDADCRVMHQNYPFISTWDDHESANNSWRDGAENHTEGPEGTWTDRKAASLQAYYEWMPIRRPDEENFERIFRKISYGDLADIFVLDTRLYDRDMQGGPGDYDDPDRRLLGPEQMAWLEEGLSNSTATWKILAQQVMMGPLVLPDYDHQSILLTLNPDQWDGYTADRMRLFNYIRDHHIDNVVTLTGDIHTAWAMDLPYSIFEYNGQQEQGSVAVEFVTTSVTSTSSPIPLAPVHDLIRGLLPYIKYVDLSRKGYTMLDLTPGKAQGDFYTVHTIQSPEATEFFQMGWYANNGRPYLKNSPEATIDSRPETVLAPAHPHNTVTDSSATGIGLPASFDLLGLYPNPFGEVLVAETHLFEPADLTALIYDHKGTEVFRKHIGQLSRGRHMIRLDGISGSSGAYELILRSDSGELLRRGLIKVH